MQRCQFQAVSGGGVVSWSDDFTVRVWDLTTGTSLHTLSQHTDYVRAGTLSSQLPDLVVSGGYDHKLAVWDIRYVINQSLLPNYMMTLLFGFPL